MKPGDCTRTGSLAALKIEYAATGNESWHCAAGRLTCASKFSRRYHWFRLMSCREISLTQTCWIYQRVDCVVSSCLLSINIWIICLDSNWRHPQVVSLYWQVPAIWPFALVFIAYRLPTAMNSYCWAVYFAVRLNVLFHLPGTKMNNDLKCRL